jgi:hypothetical protein
LHVVFAVGVCFPYIDLDVCYGFAGCSFDGAQDE